MHVMTNCLDCYREREMPTKESGRTSSAGKRKIVKKSNLRAHCRGSTGNTPANRQKDQKELRGKKRLVVSPASEEGRLPLGSQGNKNAEKKKRWAQTLQRSNSRSNRWAEQTRSTPNRDPVKGGKPWGKPLLKERKRTPLDGEDTEALTRRFAVEQERLEKDVQVSVRG